MFSIWEIDLLLPSLFMVYSCYGAIHLDTINSLIPTQIFLVASYPGSLLAQRKEMSWGME